MTKNEKTAPNELAATGSEQSSTNNIIITQTSPNVNTEFDKEREKSAQVKLINMANVEVEDVEWLWFPYIPYGKVTKIEGDAGQGKTTLVLQLIGRLTTGKALFDEAEEDEAVKTERELCGVPPDTMSEGVRPSGGTDAAEPRRTHRHEPINVIYQTAEDGLGDTIKPRLIAAGADCSRVDVIDDGENPLTFVDERLEYALQRTKARLVVLDPIQGFLGAKIDMNKANEVRPAMKHLMNLAEKYKCAVVLIGHIGKCGFGKAAVNQGLGSTDFSAAPRSVLFVGRLRSDPETRVICHTKSSLAPEGSSTAFRLDKDKGFEWIGAVEISPDELMSGTAKVTKKEGAVEFLKELLKNGEQPQTDIMECALGEGYSKNTIQRAKDELGIKSTKKGDKWYWSL